MNFFILPKPISPRADNSEFLQWLKSADGLVYSPKHGTGQLMGDAPELVSVFWFRRWDGPRDYTVEQARTMRLSPDLDASYRHKIAFSEWLKIACEQTV